MENQEYDLTKFDKVLSDVAEIQEKGNFIPDCSTKEGYEASKRFVLDVTTPARKMLEQAHKETKKPFWDACKFLDEKKNELMPLLVAVEQPHKEAYKAFDEEKKRIKAEAEARVQKGFDDINGAVNSSVGASSSVIEDLISFCADFDVDPAVYGKRTDELVQLQGESIDKLTSALTQAIQAEEMQKKQEELDRIQKELEDEKRRQEAIKQENERKEREALIAKEAKEKAEKEAEEALIKQKQLAEQAAIDAENKRLADIEAAKQAEVARQAEEERRLKQEAEAREADKKYRAGVHSAILSVLTDSGISEKDAKTVITLAAKGQLPQLSINY